MFICNYRPRFKCNLVTQWWNIHYLAHPKEVLKMFKLSTSEFGTLSICRWMRAWADEFLATVTEGVLHRGYKAVFQSLSVSHGTITWVEMNGHFATLPQRHKRTSDSTGAFLSMRKKQKKARVIPPVMWMKHQILECVWHPWRRFHCHRKPVTDRCTACGVNEA